MKKVSFRISVLYAVLAVAWGLHCGLLQNAMGQTPYTIPEGVRSRPTVTATLLNHQTGAVLLDETQFAATDVIRVAEPNSQFWVNGTNFPAGKTIEIQGNGWPEGAGLLGAIRTNGTITFASDVRLIGDARITTYDGNTTYSGNFSTAGDANYQLEKTGGGTLAIRPASGNNASFNGSWLISAGYVDLNQTGTSTAGDLSFGKGPVILDGGGIQSNSNDETKVYSNIEVRSTGVINTGRNLSLYGGLTGTGTLTKTGAYSFKMYGDNSEFEGTFINNQSNVYIEDLRVGSAKAAWVLNGSDFCIENVGAATTNTFYMGSLSGATNNFRTDIADNITFEIGALNTDTTFAGRLSESNSGTIALTKVGTGTLTFRNSLETNNTYSAGTTIKEGAIRLDSLSTLGTGNVAVEAAGALKLSRSVATSIDSKYSIQGGLEVQKGVVTFDSDQAGMRALSVASVATVNTNGKDVRVSSEYNQAGNLYKVSGGSMSLAGSDLANGATVTLSGGTLSLTAAGVGITSLPVTTGLSARFDASELTAGTVTSWADSSGNNNNANRLLTTGTPVGSITVEENALNGNSVVRFPADGNTGLGFTNRITDIRTVFWVAKDDGSHNQSFLLGDDGGNGVFNFHRGSNRELWYNHGNTNNLRNGTTHLNGVAGVDGLVTPLDTDWNLIAVQTSGNVAANALCTERSSANRSWDGAMAEVLIFNTVLSDAEMQDVTQYLNQKWGLGMDYAPISDPTATVFSAPTTSVVLGADSAMDVANFESVTLEKLDVAGKRLTMGVNGTAGTKIATDIDLGSGGIIDMQGGALNQIGDLTGSGRILGDYSLDGDIYLAINDPQAFSAIFVDGDFALDNDAKIILDILDPDSITADVLLMDISGTISGLSESSFESNVGDFYYRFGDSGGVYLSNGSDNAVPEPATWLMLALGGLMLAFYRKRAFKICAK